MVANDLAAPLYLLLIPSIGYNAECFDLAQLFGRYAVTSCGRPVLVLRDDATRRFPKSFDSIAVAWNFGRAATRAVADALPSLERAKNVRIFTVTGEKAIKKPASTTALVGHLGRHGIKTTADDVESNRRAIGDVFKTHVEEHKVDLLVMGAYGHSKMREFILGGATVSMLSHPPTWVLMSH